VCEIFPAGIKLYNVDLLILCVHREIKLYKSHNNNNTNAKHTHTTIMSGVLRVGLYNKHITDATIATINNKFNNSNFALQFNHYESYSTTTTTDLPDVFVVDSILLPQLVKKQQVLELNNSSSTDAYDFAQQAGQVNGKVYGLPQYIATQFLFYDKSKEQQYSQVKTIFDVVNAKGNDKLIYPQVSEDYNVVLSHVTYTGSLPTKSAEVNQEFAAAYKKVVDATEIALASEFNADDSVLISYTAPEGNNSLGVKSLSLSSNGDKKLYYVDVVVVNAAVSEQKREAAIQLASIIANTQQQDFLSANKSLFQQQQQNEVTSVVLQDINNGAAQAHQFDIQTIEDNTSVRKVAKIILPHVQNTVVATIRTLSADVVQKANSGHPGMPIGMAAIAYTLWSQYYHNAPKNSKWINRDRFVLSNGHGCVLQYVMLHLAGFNVTLDNLKNFRQLDSNTPGHPEFGWTDGIDATTGPLGQGLANLVGMAMAQYHLGARFNTEETQVLDHFLYGFCSDGDLMEGVALEALSQAGHHKLGNLIMIYDDNKITIDGSTGLAMTEDIAQIAQGYGWHIEVVEEGDSNLVAMKQAIENARRVTDKPSMILLRTTIGFSTTKQGTAGVHGSPLGPDAIKTLKQLNGFNPDESFSVSDSVYAVTRKIGERGNKLYDEWVQRFEQYKQKNAEKAQQFDSFFNHKLPENWDKCLPDFSKKGDMATRQCSSVVLNAIAPVIENLVGGSADLTPSTLTFLDISKDFQPESRHGRYLRFGVREHSMISVGNGMCYYGGLIPYVSTFLIFAGYGLGAIRLGALSHLPLIYVLTHDSIGLGEDGPTHQPVEVIPLLRAIPNLVTFRPADGTETNAAYKFGIESKTRPTAIALTRQKTPFLPRSTIEGALRGAYVVFSTTDNEDKPDLIIVATGSEVGIAIDGAKKIQGKTVNVVSMPAWELFDEQSLEYRQSILIPGVPILSVEASGVFGWTKYAHSSIGMTTFGASGPFEQVYEKFGITDKHVAERGEKMIKVYNQQNPAPTVASTTPEF
jgi:transketolase